MDEQIDVENLLSKKSIIDHDPPPILLTPSEVAELFRVDPKTVTRWARSGKISSIRTPGGHRRYNREEVYELLEKSFTGDALSKSKYLDSID